MEAQVLAHCAEDQLKSYRDFLEKHDVKIKNIRDKLHRRKLNVIQYNAIQIQAVDNNESFNLTNFQEFNGRYLSKLLLTFGSLFIEGDNLLTKSKDLQQNINELNNWITSLTMINHNTDGDDNNDGSDNDKDDDNGGKENNNNKDLDEIILKISNAMSFFCDVRSFMQRINLIICNLLLQCGAFLNDNDNRNANHKTALVINLFGIFDVVTRLLEQILIFNELLSHGNYHQLWLLYKKTIEVLINKPKYNQSYTQAELNGLTNALQEVEIIFSANMFQNFLDTLPSIRKEIGSKALKEFNANASNYMSQQLSAIHDCIKTKSNNELYNFKDAKVMIRLNLFCVVVQELCGQTEGKNIKTLIDLNCKHHEFMLHPHLLWLSTQIVMRYTIKHNYNKMDVKKLQKLLKTQQQQQAVVHFESLLLKLCNDEYVRATHVQVTLWVLRFHKTMRTNRFNLDLKIEHFKEIINLLVAGRKYSEHLYFITQLFVEKYNEQHQQQQHFSQISVTVIWKMYQLYLLLKHTCCTYSKQLVEIINYLMQYMQYKILHQYNNVIKQNETHGQNQNRSKETIAALDALYFGKKCFVGPPTRTRLLLASMALNITNGIVNVEQHKSLMSMLQRMEHLHHFMQSNNVDQRMNFDMPTIFSSMSMGNVIHTMLSRCLLNEQHHTDLDMHTLEISIASSTTRKYKRNDIMNSNDDNPDNYNYNEDNDDDADDDAHVIYNDIMKKMCGEIEIFLRVEALHTLITDNSKPFETIMWDYNSFRNSQPILSTNGSILVLQHNMENTFSSIFYNLTTITLQDWKSYERMRYLANKRLSMYLVNDGLPNHVIDQGIDVLEIIQNIYTFVSAYSYNMNLQMFVEKTSSSKHLDTIEIRHMANSVRTHGTGIINTTVNFIYQFLRQKFYMFSTFLYDEQIKARLIREMRAFTERKQKKLNVLYSYETAEIFNKDIRKLGLSKDGETYMDLFRKVITQVGNTMGYIRLVRSGCKNAIYWSGIFLPKFKSQFDWTDDDNKGGHQLHEVTKNSVKNFNNCLENILCNFYDCTDYFELLKKAFQPFFGNQHNQHLKNFFLIVPPLMLNYVEYMLKYKSTYNKRNSHQKLTLLFDDGFPVGLSFILKLLNQSTQFNELRWHASMSAQLRTEREKIKLMSQQISDAPKGDSVTESKATAAMGASGAVANAFNSKDEQRKLQQTLALTEQRLNVYEKEINLLFYNIKSAEIIFQ